MQEELEKGQTFQTPVVNVLHEAAEAARTNSTYIQQRLAGEPRVGPPTNKQPEPGHELDYSTGAAPSGHGSVAEKDNSGGFNPSTFGANSGLKHLAPSGNQLHATLEESQTAGPTAASTAEGNNPASSYADPLGSLLGDSEFSFAGPLGVGYHSNSLVPEGPGIPKNKIGNNVNIGHNYSIEEDKSYSGKAHNSSGNNLNNLSGGQAAFDSYLGDNR